jgi:hypothetical protein
MKENLARLVLAIASLELTEREVRDLIQELRRTPIDELTERVASLRNSSLSWSIDRKTSDTQPELLSRPQRDATVGQRVERLLKTEARLTTAVAADRLATMMVELGLIAANDVPPLSKKALRIWIERVVQKVPEKEVLRCATVLRNEFVHSPGADWTLGTRSK